MRPAGRAELRASSPVRSPSRLVAVALGLHDVHADTVLSGYAAIVAAV